MAEVKWIKITTDIFDDEKIILIEQLPEADSIIVIWFKLLTLAGKSNYSGVFLLSEKVPYTEEMLSAIFRKPINVVRLALQTFVRFGMIQIIDDVISITNWKKYQTLDKYEKQKEKTNIRVKKFREKENKKLCNVTETLHVTQCNALDKDIEKDKDKELEVDKDSLTKNDKTTNNDKSKPIGSLLSKNPFIIYLQKLGVLDEHDVYDIPELEEYFNNLMEGFNKEEDKEAWLNRFQVVKIACYHVANYIKTSNLQIKTKVVYLMNAINNSIEEQTDTTFEDEFFGDYKPKG